MRNLSWDIRFRKNMAIDFRPTSLRFSASSLYLCQPTEDSPSWLRRHGRGVMIPLLTCEGLNARQVNKED